MVDYLNINYDVLEFIMNFVYLDLVFINFKLLLISLV